ncbi:DNA ligase-1 [Brevibacillus aydinogluensis]|uniref:ATP-dependent DNA ligase n=1 Tax=Brevibacillus aydinogluensis TaxID=927786 RepID=UPI002892AE8F|nr:RNA ligase family protein [Brevibacillus aydinogluensis]MDT3417107.1 DNA ligase-1 [Brevibacillus aydinogluensis]
MLLEQVDKPFSDERFLFEPKIDGFRLILIRKNGVTKLFTRHGNDVTAKYSELISEGPDVILDGELTVIHPETGIPDFELTMSRFHSNTSKLPISYVVFDILQYGPERLNLIDQPLLKRKELLEEVIDDTPTMCKIAYIHGRGEDLFQAIVNRKMEGIVAKRLDSTIAPGRRSKFWLKVINYQYASVFITGIRKGEFGWLASIKDQNGQLKNVGIIELGVSVEHKRALKTIFPSLRVGEDEHFVYLQPTIQAKVKFRHWTSQGLMRLPVFIEFDLV